MMIAEDMMDNKKPREGRDENYRSNNANIYSTNRSRKAKKKKEEEEAIIIAILK